MEARKVSWCLEDSEDERKRTEGEKQESPRQQKAEERFETAEAAVKIVRRLTSTKNKHQRQQQIVELCTDIATLLEAKKRLENLVSIQNEELLILRSQQSSALPSSSVQQESTQTETAPHTASSGFSEPPPTPFTAGDFDSLRLYTPTGVSPAATPSSGRGTWVCDRGTDPLYAWPETSETVEPDSRSPSSSSLPTSPSPQVSSSSTPETVEERSEGSRSEGESYEADFESESGTNKDEERDIELDKHQESKEKISDEESVIRTERIEFESDNKNTKRKENQNRAGQKSSSERSGHGTKSAQGNRKENSAKKTAEDRRTSNKPITRKESNQKDKKTLPRGGRTERTKSFSATSAEKKKKGDRILDKLPAKDKNYRTMWKANDIALFDKRENLNVGTRASSQRSKRSSSSPVSTRRPLSQENETRKSCGKSYKESQLSESSSSSEDSDDFDEIRRKALPDFSSEYWDIHKLVKYLKIGNPTATVIALCALRDLSLDTESSQQAILELGGLLVLVNLLKTDERRCKIGSLQVLRDMSNNKRINMEIFRLGGLHQLIACLDCDCSQTQSLAAEVLSHVVTFRKAYSSVRRRGGIQKLVRLLTPSKPRARKSWQRKAEEPTLCRNVCMALWSCSRSVKNVQVIRDAGAVPVLRTLLDSESDDVIRATVGIVQECASDSAFQDDIRKERMVEMIVKHLKSGNAELKELCAKAIEKCAEDEKTRDLVRREGGLEAFVALLAPSSSSNKELLAAAVGALWKCSINKDNLFKLEELGALTLIIQLLKANQPHAVVSKLLGALREFCQHRRNLFTILEDKVLQNLVKLLNLTEAAVLVSTCHVLAVCSRETMCRRVILNSDGLRLLWSVLKFPDPKICTSSMDAITECTVDPNESAQIVRSFVGGLEMVTKLLRSDLKEVQKSSSKAIINLGKDRENLSIMTDYDVVPLLISLSYTEDEELRTCVAEAIATCCGLEKNVTAFSPAVIPLVDGVKKFKGVAVHRASARALERLSKDPHNCCIMHQHGILKNLVSMTGSSDEPLQEAAANCIKNIRVKVMKTLQSQN